MNVSVVSYGALLVTALALTVLSFHKFRLCTQQIYDYQRDRDYKPSMLWGFICLSWSVVASNGIWVKWYNAQAKLTVDTPILVLLICATLYAGAYLLIAYYRWRIEDELPR